MEKKKVMIVDDDRDFLEELKEIINLSGYETETFTDSKQAVQEVQKVKPDVMLLDLKMSGMSGFQVAEELKKKKETANIPVIAMTGFYTRNEFEVLKQVCKIRKALIKPFNPLDVISQIESVLK